MHLEMQHPFPMRLKEQLSVAIIDVLISIPSVLRRKYDGTYV